MPHELFAPDTAMNGITNDYYVIPTGEGVEASFRSRAMKSGQLPREKALLDWTRHIGSMVAHPLKSAQELFVYTVMNAPQIPSHLKANTSSGIGWWPCEMTSLPLVEIKQVLERIPIASWDADTMNFIEWDNDSFDVRNAVRSFYEDKDADS